MKITQINLRHLRMALRTPFETSFGRTENRHCLLIEAHAGDLVGYGECVADARAGLFLRDRPDGLAHHPGLPGPGDAEPGYPDATGAAGTLLQRARPPDGQGRAGDGAVGSAGQA